MNQTFKKDILFDDLAAIEVVLGNEYSQSSLPRTDNDCSNNTYPNDDEFNTKEITRTTL
jgi:hypothetical protein